MVIALWWIRRDLRLHDQIALTAALRAADAVIPVFILDPVLRSVSPRRQAFLMAALQALDHALRKRGSYLVVRAGPPLETLGALMAETGARLIFAEEDFTPYARERDERIAHQLPLHRIGFPTIRHPASIVKPNGMPYRVFGAFRRMWRSTTALNPNSLQPAPVRIPTPPGIPSLPLFLERAERFDDFPPSEEAALERLRSFTEGEEAPIYRYHRDRNWLDREGSARLSPYLRFGMLSPRRAAIAAWQAMERAPHEEARQGASAWLDELIWREFFITLFFHFPNLAERPLRPEEGRIRWREDPEALQAWIEGRTGYPLVDAGMRQLRATGWMPNRARMVAASFLTRALRVDWRLGAQVFFEELLDGDPAVNVGNWQWVAGVGTDYASGFRAFNPTVQARTWDPAGRYIRRWVPELEHVPDSYVHAPWTMPEEVQRTARCRIGVDYPAPMVGGAHGQSKVEE